MRNSLKRVLLVPTIASLSFFASGHSYAEAPPLYTITKAVPLGSPDKWDYLHFDPASQRLYVAHGDHLAILDGKSGKIIGDVNDMPGGSHGEGIVNALGKGYTDDGHNGVVVVFDLKTFKTLKKIKAEEDADGIVFDKNSGHIFVIDGDSGKITVIDPLKNEAVGTVDVGSKLEFGVSGENGKLYVNGEEKSEVVRVDTATNKVDAHWPIADCTSPHGIDIDLNSHRLFVSCKNEKLDVVNADTGKEITSLPIGKGSDAVLFDPARKLVFSSNFDGTLSVIHEKSADDYTTLEPVKTAIGARTMSLDSKTGRIYLATADYTVDPSAGAADFRHRYKVTTGTAKILFLDPSVAR